jgi:leucine dehydrogenase
MGGSGDPSPVTAQGVFYGMKACAHELYGKDSLKGLRVTIQGLGHVGTALAELLAAEKAELCLTDLNMDKAQKWADKLNGKAIGPDEVFQVEGDIYSPAALGGTINNESLSQFGYKIIAGSANNQLADEVIHGEALKKMGILYAPDYVINAGGLINVWNELSGYNEKKALKEVRGIYETLKRIFAIAKKEDLPTNLASNRLAERRIAQLSKLSHIHIPHQG